MIQVTPGCDGRRGHRAPRDLLQKHEQLCPDRHSQVPVETFGPRGRRPARSQLVGCGSQGIAQNFQTGAPLADEQMWATGQTSPGHAGAPDMNERTSSCEDVARRAETHHFNLLYPGSRHREE